MLWLARTTFCSLWLHRYFMPMKARPRSDRAVHVHALIITIVARWKHHIWRRLVILRVSCLVGFYRYNALAKPRRIGRCSASRMGSHTPVSVSKTRIVNAEAKCRLCPSSRRPNEILKKLKQVILLVVIDLVTVTNTPFISLPLHLCVTAHKFQYTSCYNKENELYVDV